MSRCHFRSIFLQDRWQELNVSVIQLTFSHRQCSTILLYTLHQDTALCFHTSLGGCMHDSAVLIHHTNVCLLNVTPQLNWPLWSQFQLGSEACWMSPSTPNSGTLMRLITLFSCQRFFEKSSGSDRSGKIWVFNLPSCNEVQSSYCVISLH